MIGKIICKAYEFIWHDTAVKCRAIKDWSEMSFLYGDSWVANIKRG